MKQKTFVLIALTLGVSIVPACKCGGDKPSTAAAGGAPAASASTDSASADGSTTQRRVVLRPATVRPLVIASGIRVPAAASAPPAPPSGP